MKADVVPGEGSPRRLETLNDGVFAIVMTLIVLQIRVPTGPISKQMYVPSVY
jgi:uncharacterized membrane protein